MFLFCFRVYRQRKSVDHVFTPRRVHRASERAKNSMHDCGEEVDSGGYARSQPRTHTQAAHRRADRRSHTFRAVRSFIRTNAEQGVREAYFPLSLAISAERKRRRDGGAVEMEREARQEPRPRGKERRLSPAKRALECSECNTR